jgi:hypothetical protein
LSAVLRVAAPADTSELAGGAAATIEWRASAPLPAEVEEWEAFLSVDGGRYYALRITPHLDRDIRRFTFTVPNVTSADARILLRFGDEERETELESPLRFTIRYDGLAPRTWTTFADEVGESARVGAQPIVAWAAGGRDGAGLRNVTHRDASYSAARMRGIHLPLGGDADETAAGHLHAPAASARILAPDATRTTVAGLGRRLHDPLLDTMRLNI